LENGMHTRVGFVGIVVLAGVVGVTGSQTAQPPQEPQRSQGVIKEGVRAVLVDVVVRDRRGQPVRDLTQADFEIVEDGAPQTIGSFTRVLEGSKPEPGAASPSAPGANTASPVVDPGPGVTALVFDRLQPESRRIAAQAARSYLGSKEESADVVAVFGIDLSFT
jgi:VWFA-related protein